MKKLFLLSILTLFVGCGPSVKFVKTGATHAPLSENNDVVVYLEEGAPKNIEVIGYAKTIGPEVGMGEINEAIKKKARAVGGDIAVLKEKKVVGATMAGPGVAVLIHEFRFLIGKRQLGAPGDNYF